MLLNVEHLYKYFNGQALLKDINFTVEDREAVGFPLVLIIASSISALGATQTTVSSPTGCPNVTSLPEI